jgi:hypothetical protein
MVLELADAGERVIVLDNLSTGHDWAVPPGVPLIVGDSGDQELVGRLLRDEVVDAIIHFATSIVVPDSVRDPPSYYRNNTVNTRALIECAVKAGVRNFIFSSTAAVYGNPAEIPVTENAALQPISPYGWSKLMSELMLRDAGRAHGLNHVILRYFNVAGRAATHLIKVAVETALGFACEARRLRQRLSDARRLVRSRLYSRQRPRARTFRCAAPSACGPTIADTQLRLQSRLFGAGRGRDGQACVRRRFQGRDGAAARRRSRADCGRLATRARSVALAAALR